LAQLNELQLRRAVIEEERLQYEKRLRASSVESDKMLESERERVASAHSDAKKLAEERDAALAQLNELKISRVNTLKGIAEATTRLVQKIDQVATFAVFLLAAISASNYVFGWLVNYRIPSVILGAGLAVFAAYHQIMNALERPSSGCLP